LQKKEGRVDEQLTDWTLAEGLSQGKKGKPWI
jgi:hypothetical protein